MPYAPSGGSRNRKGGGRRMDNCTFHSVAVTTHSYCAHTHICSDLVWGHRTLFCIVLSCDSSTRCFDWPSPPRGLRSELWERMAFNSNVVVSANGARNQAQLCCLRGENFFSALHLSRVKILLLPVLTVMILVVCEISGISLITCPYCSSSSTRFKLEICMLFSHVVPSDM